jgi:hypothetical protein
MKKKIPSMPGYYVLCIWLFYFTFLPVSLNAQQLPATFDTLGGPLPKLVPAKTYIIVTDIEVSPNKIVTIEPGAVFLFKNFTGLKVLGRLSAKGLVDKPIVFTSEFDNVYNPYSSLQPNPYDWNGIYIYVDGFATTFENCIISYTVYGLISDTKIITLNSVKILNNGKNNLTIVGKLTTCSGDLCSYTPEKSTLPLDPRAKKRNFFRYSGLVLALGGIAVGIASYETRFKESQNLWRKANKYPPDLEFINQQNSQYYDKLKKDRNSDLALMLAGFGIGLIGTVEFVWSFTF